MKQSNDPTQTSKPESVNNVRYFNVNKTLVEKLGLIDANILSNYIEKSKYWQKRNKDFDGWFFLTYKQQQEQLNTSGYALRQARKRFLNLGLLKIQRRGIPSKDYYKLNLNVISELSRKNPCPTNPQKTKPTNKNSNNINKYAELLQHPQWQKKRLEIMSRDSFSCKLCKDSETTLHVHHTKYNKNKKPWECKNDDLITVCEHCHESIHQQGKVNNILTK